jgi:hypothetical protein
MSYFRSSFLTIWTSVITCTARLKLKGDEEQEHVGGLSITWTIFITVKFVNKMFGCNGGSLFIGNTGCRFRLEVHVFWNTSLNFLFLDK